MKHQLKKALRRRLLDGWADGSIEEKTWEGNKKKLKPIKLGLTFP